MFFARKIAFLHSTHALRQTPDTPDTIHLHKDNRYSPNVEDNQKKF